MLRGARALVRLGPLLLLLGCDGSPAIDAGADPDAGLSSEVAAPRLAPCPDGWDESTDGCAPFPADAPPCGPDAHQLPGMSACAPVGECPPGPWPTELPAGERLYVSAAAAIGGDGAEARPFATIRPALMRATAGSVIVVGEGTYDEAVVLNQGVSLVGLCPARTRLHLTATPAASQTVAAVGGETLLRGVTVTGDAFAFVAQGAAAVTTLEQVVFRDFDGLAMVVTQGAAVTGRDIAVIGPEAGLHGAAEIDDGSSLALERSSLRGLSEAAVLVYGAGARFTADDSVIRDTRGSPAAMPPPTAVVMEDGATVELRRTAIVGSAGFGVFATNGASLLVESSVVEDTVGIGVNVWLGSQLTMRQSQVLGAGDVGVHVRESTATLEDLVIAGSRARGPRGRGTGLIVFSAEAELSRVRVAANQAFGAVVAQISTLRATDLTIVGTESDPDTGEFGRGLTVQRGSTATIDRAIVSDNRDVGVLAALDGATITLTNATVSGTREAACVSTTCPTRAGGMGVVVVDTGTISATDLTLRANAFVGIHGLPGGQLDVMSGVVEGHPIGMNIQGDGIDPATDLRGVEFLDNERNVARDTIEPPQVSDVFSL